MSEQDDKPSDADRRIDITSETAEVSAEASANVDPIYDGEPDQQHDRSTMAVDGEEAPRLTFPVVGIGASAGGLEVLTAFIEAMRPDSGMAFVFIQHLPPDHETLLAEILQKKTEMIVFLIEDGMEVKPNHLYVIRPGHVVRIRDGRLHLGPQLGRGVANRPVDDFFKSLAEEQRERAIGIIMSGMGSNGSAGAQAIKAVGGLVIAQDPESASYPSMPRHLIDQGHADYILAPADMPEILLQYAGHPYAREARQNVTDQVRRHANQLREILAILRTRTRKDFNGYKKPTIIRRVQRRMGLTRLTDMGEYARLLRQSPNEVSALADDLLIHVTGFFRDRVAWDALHKSVIAPLVARREPDSEIRAWITACSSGEEAYTMAMLLVEEADRAGKVLDIKVFATDMAERPLAHARAGVYAGGIESEIDPDRLERFFEKEDGLYRIKQYLRECVIFAPQNVLQDPPFSRIDIVSCRNLLIYLEADVQQRLLSLLHFGLREGGMLFLGTSETVSGADDLYELIDKRARIYRRIGPTRHGMLDFPLPHAIRSTTSDDTPTSEGPTIAETARSLDRRLVGRPSLASMTARALLEHHTPAAITVDRDYRVLYFHGNTRPFVEQPPGELTRDLMMLIREGLRGAVRAALRACTTDHGPASVMEGWVAIEGGAQVRVAVTASPVAADARQAPDYYVISFEQRGEIRPQPGDAAPPAGTGESTDELRRVRDELQTTIEELQTTNEELKASHEEVTSINEEVQSSNEELETSKEEMQSLNEELTTVNAQLQAKMDEHQGASNDLTALLSSTSIAVLFLDSDLRIRRFTPLARDLIELISTDIGRPLLDMHRKFDDPALERDLRTVLDHLTPIETEIIAANERSYARRVLPYRTLDNRIDGLVITFVDVTDRKRIERETVDARKYAEQIIETLHEPLLVLHPDLRVRSANAAFYTHFKVNRERTVGQKIYELGNGQWNIPALRTALEEVLPAKSVFNNYEVTHEFEDLGHRVMLLNGRQLEHEQLILLGVRDVTADRQAEADVRASEERLRRMVNVEGVGVLTFEIASGSLVDANDAFLSMCGYSRDDVNARRLDWRTLTPPEYAEESYRQMARMRETGRIGPYEKEYIRKDGARSWMLFAGADMGDGTAVEYCIDVSARKRAEIVVHEREARLAAIFSNAAVGLCELSPQGRFTLVNDTLCTMLGRSREDLLQMNVLDVTAPQDREASFGVMKHVIEADTVESSENRYLRPDGSVVEASSTLTRLNHLNDQPATLLVVTIETTSRRHAERAVAASEEQLRLLVEGARDFAMIMQDPGGTITAWNSGAQRLLGYGEREAIGQFGGIIFTEEDRLARAPEKELETAATKGRAEDERWHVRKDGSRFWGSGVQTALRHLDGSIRGFVKVMRDQTERKRVEEALTQSKESAEVSNRMKDDFLATLSHELRTPLTAIMIWTKLLRDGSLGEAQRADGLSAIEQSAQSQKQLIDDLLDSSRITSGKLRLEMTNVPLAELVRSTVDAIGPTADAKSITVTTDLSGECGTVRADPERLRQIVWNLLTNAVKFTPAGGQIEVGLWRRKNDIEIRVTDSGRGIEAAFLPRIFERFTQADGGMTRTSGGLGLGLAIVKQLVELHGGTIAVESAGVNAGATFRVLLPLPSIRTSKLPAGRHAAEPSRRASTESVLSGVRVVLVEDQATSRAAIRALLRSAGAEVVDVASAEEALGILSGEAPDVLLSDIALPEMDGHALMRQLRAAEAGSAEPPLRTIALTAFASEEDEHAALSAGFNSYLSKPFTSAALIAAIRSLLDDR